MAAGLPSATENADSLASLERLKRVETDGDAQLRMVRGRIDLALAQLRADSEDQIKAAQKEADQEGEILLAKAEKDADAEAERLLAEAKAALAQRATAGLPDLTPVWPSILNVLFGEFR
jgi:F0F1-type ATP synthase membrane subunit b/b'